MKAIVSILFFLFASSAMAKKAAVLSGYDNLALPEKEVEITVKAEKAKIFPFRSDIKKQEIQYFLDGQKIGSARTRKDGLAKLKFQFQRPGLYLIKSKLAPWSKYTSKTTDNRVLVAGVEQPIIISDIDHTISDISGREYLRTADEMIPELPGASTELNKLSSKFLIVYLTARDDFFIKRSKYWLDYKKFPKGPIFFWDFGFWNDVPSNHGEYKEAQIRKLKATHPKILIGVGDKPHDVEAYIKNNMRAYYIGLPTNDLAKGAIKVKSWIELRKHLVLNPIGTLDGDPRP